MNEPDDVELARRLRDHYRATATGEVPASLRATIEAGRLSHARGRSWRFGPAAAGAAALIVVIGGAFVVGSRPIAPAATPSPAVASGGSIAPSSTPASSVGPTASAASGITGEVAVLRGTAIRDAAATATDETPFLIGGTISIVMADCLVPPDFPETPLLRVCGDGMMIGNGRGFGGSPVVSDMLPTGPGLGFSEPAVVIRVHTHDERAATCPPAYLVECEHAIVVDQVVWRPGAGGSTAIPAVLSILPPQVDARQCDAREFGYVRCIAVVERARGMIGIGWPDVRSVTLARPSGGGVSLGSLAIANVLILRVDGTEHDVEVRCLFLRSASLLCGPSTVEVIVPSPAVSTPPSR